jgi:dolichol-phosphate mannosyltransferase/undecaprenyl-phosphate 4-deoxy-4-formamido-L-arabinose transferase
VAVTTDDDLQHPPEEIPKLIAAICEHPQWDCVMGRYHRKQHGWFRNLGSALMRSLYVRFYSAPRNVWPSSFRIMTRQFAQALCQHRTANPIICPLIFQTTRRVGNVDVRHEKRSYGKSGYPLLRLMGTVGETVIRGTTYPLHLISLFGLLIALGAAGLELYYFIRYFSDPSMLKGFTTQVLLIIFFGGMSLFAIGLVGEYLARVIEEVRRPPRYVIRQHVSHQESDSHED